MTSRPVLVYTVLRLLAFLVPLGVLWLLFPDFPLVAAVMAAAIGASLSILFLRRPRDGVSEPIYSARQKRTKVTDADVEDSVVDGNDGGAGADSGADSAEDSPRA